MLNISIICIKEKARFSAGYIILGNLKKTFAWVGGVGTDDFSCAAFLRSAFSNKTRNSSKLRRPSPSESSWKLRHFDFEFFLLLQISYVMKWDIITGVKFAFRSRSELASAWYDNHPMTILWSYIKSCCFTLNFDEKGERRRNF